MLQIRLERPLMRAVSALALAAGSLVASVTASADTGRNKAVVQEAFAAWAAGTGGPYDLLATDVRWTITGNSVVSKTYLSREAFMQEVIRPFNARMSRGLRPSIHSIYTEGETVIVYFDAGGTARDGKPYQNTYAWFLEMANGKIVRSTAFFDSIAFNEFWHRVTPAPSN